MLHCTTTLHRQWSHSYLRALCSSSICSLTVLSSFSRAMSVPFTHVYTTSIGMGRQSLQKETLISDPVCLSGRTLSSSEYESVFIHAWLHFLQFFHITFKGRVQSVFSGMKEGFCRKCAHFCIHICEYEKNFSLLNPTKWNSSIYFVVGVSMYPSMAFAHLLWKDFPPTLSL